MRPQLRFIITLSLAIGFAPDPVSAQTPAPGEILYQKLCAACHGQRLEGGLARSLVDSIWQFGSGRNDILRNIKYGIPDFSMPGFDAALSDPEILQIIDFLKAAEKTSGFSKPPPPDRITTVDYDVHVETWVREGLNIPWSIAFTPDGRAFITERGGQLRVVVDGKLRAEPVQHTPAVHAEGQGGLLDVALDPEFTSNGWVYLSYSHCPDPIPTKASGTMTRLARGRIVGNRWTDEQILYSAPPECLQTTRHHYGSRIAFDREVHVYFSVGDRGQGPDAQNLAQPNGKIHRLKTDGSIPKDNPFIGIPGAAPSLFSFGHRNPQGLATDPRTGRIWESEHGPMGGDELNLLIGGRNYGWPLATYGRDYSGSGITDVRQRPGLESPIAYWNPSPALCGMEFITGRLFPRWRHKLMVGALKYEEIRLLTLEHDRVIHQETLLKNAGRVRDIGCAPDGAIHVVLNGPDLILRLTPIRDMNDGPE